MSFRNSAILTGVVASALLVAAPARSQDQWSWPEHPQNLIVLPKDWTGSQLRPVMFGFTRSLGVRCAHCHQGEEGKPLSTFDFVSDANPNKNRAREMMRMLGDIKEHLNKIEPSGDKRVNMSCATCHHGRPRPTTLEEELGETYRHKGIDAALAQYQELKKDYYGRAAFDFGVGALNNFGYEVLKNNDISGALAVFKLNTEVFPEAANAWDSLAETYMKSGDLKQAKAYYEKSLALDPQNHNAQAMLKKIAEGEGK